MSVRVGTIVTLSLKGTSAYPWQSPANSAPAVLVRLSVTMSGGNLTARWRATIRGSAHIVDSRATQCVEGPMSGICTAEAQQWFVTVAG